MSYARTAVTRMTLDMSRLDLQRSETISLGDANRRWEVTLINGGAPFRLPNNWAAWIAGVKPDGKPLMLGCSIVDGKIIFDFARGKEIATCVGSFAIQIDIADEMAEIVATPKIYVNVLETARPLDDLESDGQYELIGETLIRIGDAETDILENAQNIAENKLIIATQDARVVVLESMVTEYGSIKIETAAWKTTQYEGYNYIALVAVEGFKRGTVLTMLPSTDKTRKASVEARLVSSADGFKADGDGYVVELLVKSKPTIALDMAYILNKSPMDSSPAVAVLGIDASPDEEVAAIREAMSEYGSIKIETSAWKTTQYEGYNYIALVKVEGFKRGTVLTMMPSTDLTRKAAVEARLVSSADGFKADGDGYVVELLVKSKPTIALEMTYILNKSPMDSSPAVAVLGIDASPDEEVAAIREAMSEYGSVSIEENEWKPIEYEGYNFVAWLSVNGFGVGTVLTLTPSTELTRKEAAAAGLAASGDGFIVDEENYQVEILVKSKPTTTLELTYILNKSALDLNPAVAVLGMDMPNTESAQELVAQHNKDKEAHPHLLQLIDAVEKALSGVSDTKIHVLDELPALADAVVYHFYLILGEDKEQGDLYDEYICLQDEDKVKYWEYIGTRKIDLSNYMTSAEIVAEIARQIGLIQFPQVPEKLPNPKPITIFGKTYDGSASVSVTKQEIVQAVIDVLNNWEEVPV